MAVVVKFVVERNGKEVMTFTSKKEADAYDKQLDIAERLQEFIGESGIELADEQLDELTLYMAKYRDDLAKLLKGAAVAKPAAKPKQSADTDAEAAVERPKRGGRPKAVAA